MGVGGHCHALAALLPAKGPSSHCTRTDHLIPGQIFFSGKLRYAAKWQQGRTGGNSVQVYVHNRKPVSPHIWSVEASQWTSTCSVSSHDGGESSAACVHHFLFLSGENWCWNVRNATSSFRRVLPKLISPFEWYSHFKSGCCSFEDDPHPGRPSTSHTEETVARVREIIRADRRLTIREVAE